MGTLLGIYYILAPDVSHAVDQLQSWSIASRSPEMVLALGRQSRSIQTDKTRLLLVPRTPPIHHFDKAIPQHTVHAVSIDRANTMSKLNVSRDTRLLTS
jgi:hypothetical protein